MVAYVNHKNEYANEWSTLRGCGGSMEGRKKKFFCAQHSPNYPDKFSQIFFKTPELHP